MLIGYYDRNGYPDLYTGEIAGGICPITDQNWVDRWGNGSPGLVSFVASKKGIDGLTTNGHIDDFYNYFGAEDDPFYGEREPHCSPGKGNCLADFMGTSQWYPDNLQLADGASAYDDPNIIQTEMMSSTVFGDAAYGIKLFIESKGYTVDSYGNAFAREEKICPSDILFSDYQTEIDNKRPVIIHLKGHSMLGIGYNPTLNKIFFHDTWDRNIHSMDWDGTYANMGMRACSFIRLAPSQESEVDVEISSNLEVASGTIAPFGTFSLPSGEATSLKASDTSTQRFVRWETSGAVTVADTASAETSFTATASGGQITAVYEELENLNIKSLKLSVTGSGKDYIRLDLNNNFPDGITSGKLIIDNFEYEFSNIPANANIKNGNLVIMNKKNFVFYLKKQTLDLFDSADGLWVELQIDGTNYCKDIEHGDLRILQLWKSSAPVNGTNMNIARLSAIYRHANNKSLFRCSMTGTGMDAFAETPTVSFDDADWELIAHSVLNDRSIYKSVSPAKYMLKIDPIKDKWNMVFQHKGNDTDHFNENSNTVSVSLTDELDTSSIVVSCKVKQRIQYKK